jgi:probable addiction module antidote protein
MKKTSKKKASKRSVAYEPQLLEDLKDINFAAQYLSQCIDGFEDDEFEIFFSALCEIAKAHGIQNVAKKMNMTRDALYKAFRQHNARFDTMNKMLDAVGLKFSVIPKSDQARPR